jgi:hypothetical protein
MNLNNGKIVHQGEKIYVNNTTYNATFNDIEFEIITVGTSTVVLPANNGTKCAYHIFVKSGTCQITGTVDGTVNPLLTAQELEYDIVTNGTLYYTSPTEKQGFDVSSKSKISTIQNYSQAGVIAINTVLMTIDCGDASSISISCRAMGTTGVVTPRWRNEVGETGQGATIVTPAGTSVTTFNAVGMWTTPVFARYLDLVLTTATTAGTTTITATKLYGQNPIQIINGTITANIGTGSLNAGTNAIGDVGLQVRSNATGASSKTHLISAATTNPTIVKASAGRLLGWRISNTNVAWRYIKLHNQATSPTAGTGVVETIAVPPNGIAQGEIPVGSAFTTGIAMTTVTGSADTDTTAVGIGDLIIDLFWA